MTTITAAIVMITGPAMTEAGRHRFSVRQRITAAVALLTALSLLAVGITLYVVESHRVDRVIENSLQQEIAEFRALQAAGKDPDTGAGFTSADRLLTVFLERNLPDADETLFAFPLNGKPVYQGEIKDALEDSPAFATLVESLKPSGGIRTLQIGPTTYRVAVQPVRQGTRTGAFVVTHDVTASRSDLHNLMVTYGLVAALALFIIAGFASLIAGRLLKPVRTLRETARGITDGDLGARLVVTGKDDLSDLQRTFNDMLDRLESTLVAQRRLLDDAGHELRTPLTILRGHLEVLDLDNPDDVRSTRDLLLDEVDRMSRLVGDLLTLAKARRPDFIRFHSVDLDVLTQDIVEKARALGEREWALDESAGGAAVVDGQRVTQALLQLADNAVRHTATGAPIHVGSRRDGASVQFWVRDAGPGVAPEHRRLIFERFGRVDRHDGGFGLGLSIVSAIAEAHGGTIALDDTAVGATFRLTLPTGPQ